METKYEKRYAIQVNGEWMLIYPEYTDENDRAFQTTNRYPQFNSTFITEEKAYEVAVKYSLDAFVVTPVYFKVN